MSRENILAVDDEEDILELLRFNLAREGYQVSCAASGEDALRIARTKPIDLVVLDLMLPGMDGLDVTRKIKNDSKINHIPIIILSAKGEEADVVIGLELGASDYVTKPFSPRILIARIKAVLRSASPPSIEGHAIIRIHGIEIHPGRRQVILNDRQVALTYTEFQVLHYLAQRPGWVFTRSQIVDAVRGDDYPVTDRSVDVQIVGLRKKLGKFGTCIETVRGVGYRIREEAC